jgi:activator of 2-hydroxyglutaryl-CoA dehydratase
VMMGGLGYNSGFVAAVKKELGIGTLHIPEEPEYGMAVGAAVAANDLS